MSLRTRSPSGGSMLELTVATISMNQRPYLRTCVESVLALRQFCDLEYIVVDGGSTDGSVEFLQSVDGIDRLIVGEDDGPSDGLQIALEQATRERFYYVNADDFVLPDAFRLTESDRRLIDESDLAIGDSLVVDASGRVIRRFIAPRRLSLQDYVDGVYPLPQQGTLFRTGHLRSAGGFNGENRTCWDREAVVEVLLAGGTHAHLDRTLGAFRLQPDSITGSGRLRNELRVDHERIRRAARDRAGLRDRRFVRARRALHYSQQPSRLLEALTYGRPFQA